MRRWRFHLLVLLWSFSTQAGLLDGGWDDRFFLSGVQGEVHALEPTATGWYAGGTFDAVDDRAVSNVAWWTGTNWVPLGLGLNGPVLALANFGTRLYAGGSFTASGELPTSLVAEWDGRDWAPLGMGLQGLRVSALTVDDRGFLYVGGQFTNAGGVAVLNVACWDGHTWSGLGSGLGNGIYPSWVLALEVHDHELYAGGFFTEAGAVAANGIARWDGVTWSALGLGVDDRDYLPQVAALAWVGDDLYIGGAFALAGHASVQHVARWNGSDWEGLGAGITRYFGDIPVTCLAAQDSRLLVGGRFEMAGSEPARNLAFWDGVTWAEFAGGAEGAVHGLQVREDTVLLAGSFVVGDAPRSAALSFWDGRIWRPVSSRTGQGLEGERTCSLTCSGDEVRTLVSAGSAVYAGGDFLVAGDQGLTHVARWTGNNWEPLGPGLNGVVFSLVPGAGGLVAGGDFDRAGEQWVGHIAVWREEAWRPLGAGLNGPVHALVWSGGRLYAGGDFTMAGSGQARQVAVWDGHEWQALGGGIPGEVRALAWGGDGLYAGGQFTMAGNSWATNIAWWDGFDWHPLGAGVSGVPNPAVRFRPPPVSTLLWREGRLVVGGDFARAGSVAATNIAVWKDGVWSALGGGLPSALGLAPPPAVAALAIDNELLYAGGSFNRVAGGVAQGLAAWDGSKWQAFPEGVNRGRFSPPLVRALALVNENLFVGGHFKFVGTRPSSGLAVRHGPPRLAIERSWAGTIRIAWPSWANEYVLESGRQLESADWVQVEGVGSETAWQVQPATPEISSHFYRLKRRP